MTSKQANAEIPKPSKDYIAGLFKHRSNFDVDKVFKAFDLNGDGTIDNAEFEALWSHSLIFDDIDTHKRGSLTTDEIDQYFQDVYGLEIKSTDDVDELVDGWVTLTQFIVFMKKRFKSIKLTKKSTTAE